jgi:probable F420-dependent oxidoreductase
VASVGIALPSYGALGDDPWSLFAELAAIADRARVETLWLPDHLTLPEEDVRANGGRTRVDEPLDAWVLLSMLAAVTTRVRLGTEVTPLPLRQPVLLAKTVATLDVLSSGRAVLGLGAGWYRDEFDEAGIPFVPYRQRLEQTREGAALVRRLLAGQQVAWEGTFYRLGGACARPVRAGGKTPIWFGGRSDTILSLAAEHGDGWITATNASPAEVTAGRARLRDLAEQRGRDPDELRTAVPFIARVAESTPAAKRDLGRYMERGQFTGFVKQFLEDATWEHGIWGSAEECGGKLEPYLELGVDHVILDVRPPDYARDSVERICGELLPLLGVTTAHSSEGKGSRG